MAIMLDSSRFFTYSKIALPLAILFWSLWYLGTARTLSYGDEVLRNLRGEKATFVNDFLAHEIEGPFDGEPIRKLCASKKWTKDLILSCDPVPGGLGQVRNAHLNCIRFAIEAGAELLLPALIQRDPKDITRIDPSRGPPRGQTLDYLFDEQHLTASLRTYCPQMKLHRTVHDLYDVPSVLEPIRLTHRELGMSYVNESVLAAPSKWGSQLLAMVEKKSPAASRAFPVRVNIERSIFTWPNTYDAQPLARAMGRLLRPREDARRVAAAALFQLHKQFRLGLDPRMGIKRESFVGVHLRTERDVQTTFPDYLHQAVHFMDYAVDAKVPVVFLGTGATQENVTAFTDRMEDFNVTVVTKHSLLKDHHPDEYKLLEGLTFDQKGLVDYEVMLRGGLFAGRCESPFAWNVALRRVSAFSGSVGGDNKIKPHDSVRYQDRYSVLYGLSACSLFMQSSMWP